MKQLSRLIIAFILLLYKEYYLKFKIGIKQSINVRVVLTFLYSHSLNLNQSNFH